MNISKLMLLCSSRIAIPAMRDLVQSRQLAVVVIPLHCEEFMEEIQQLLTPLHIPVVSTTKEDNESVLIRVIKEHQITMIFMMSYSFKISKAVYDLPANGFYNFHPGPLPEYRGADPVFHQLKNGEKRAGVTVHLLNAGFDTGPVVMKEMIRIAPGDTYGILNNKLAELSSKLAGTLIRMILLNIPVPSVKQDESKAVYYKKQHSADIVIQWETMSGEEIIALINACNPWNKGAVTRLGYRIVRLLEAETGQYEGSGVVQAGTVLSVKDDSLEIAVINNESIKLLYIYTDEGFLRAGTKAFPGIQPGALFTTV